MSRRLRFPALEPALLAEPILNPKRKNLFVESQVHFLKIGKGNTGGVGQCADCGGDVKVFISPRRNPHSSKLGRAVSLKDHDLCRRCWRRLMHQQRQAGIVILPLAMFIGGTKLRPRLLVTKPASAPREAI